MYGLRVLECETDKYRILSYNLYTSMENEE